MAHEEKLPWELIEEILSRVSPKSLARFKTVCKPWNALLHDKKFINNHKMTFRFILATKSKIYSVSIHPEIIVRELILDTPGLESQIPNNILDCNEFLLCEMDKGSAVWNPWLKQASWIEPVLNQTRMISYGIGQNNKGSYKIVASCLHKEDPTKRLLKIHDFASDTWKDHHSEPNASNGPRLHSRTGLSLNGNLYWVTYFDQIDPILYQVTKFNSSNEGFFKFCDLPCGMTNVPKDALVLGVFKGDGFSLLKQCHATKKIEIWVSKYEIKANLDFQDVVWIKFMEVSSPNDTVSFHSQPSYFIEDKRVVVCSCDQTGRAWIYVLRENKFISKTLIDSVVDHWPSHCTFIPGLVPVPRVQREELAELQV